MANAGRERYALAMSILYVESPVHQLALESDGDMPTGVRWTSATERSKDEKATLVLREARRQLDRYFKGKLQRFDLPLAAGGTPFQERGGQGLPTKRQLLALEGVVLL
jgi:methylated-DNA-[protein]-cysteine S-methyltransferase